MDRLKSGIHYSESHSPAARRVDPTPAAIAPQSARRRHRDAPIAGGTGLTGPSGHACRATVAQWPQGARRIRESVFRGRSNPRIGRMTESFPQDSPSPSAIGRQQGRNCCGKPATQRAGRPVMADMGTMWPGPPFSRRASSTETSSRVCLEKPFSSPHLLQPSFRPLQPMPNAAAPPGTVPASTGSGPLREKSSTRTP